MKEINLKLNGDQYLSLREAMVNSLERILDLQDLLRASPIEQKLDKIIPNDPELLKIIRGEHDLLTQSKKENICGGVIDYFEKKEEVGILIFAYYNKRPDHQDFQELYNLLKIGPPKQKNTQQIINKFDEIKEKNLDDGKIHKTKFSFPISAIRKTLKTLNDVTLVEFCQDHLNDIASDFADQMTRPAKISFIIQRCQTEEKQQRLLVAITEDERTCQEFAKCQAEEKQHLLAAITEDERTNIEFDLKETDLRATDLQNPNLKNVNEALQTQHVKDRILANLKKINITKYQSEKLHLLCNYEEQQRELTKVMKSGSNLLIVIHGDEKQCIDQFVTTIRRIILPMGFFPKQKIRKHFIDITDYEVEDIDQSIEMDVFDRVNIFDKVMQPMFLHTTIWGKCWNKEILEKWLKFWTNIVSKQLGYPLIVCTVIKYIDTSSFIEKCLWQRRNKEISTFIEELRCKDYIILPRLESVPYNHVERWINEYVMELSSRDDFSELTKEIYSLYAKESYVSMKKLSPVLKDAVTQFFYGSSDIE